MFATKYLVLCVWGGTCHGQNRGLVALILRLQVGMHSSPPCVGINYVGTQHIGAFNVVAHVEVFTHSCPACPFIATKSKPVTT